MNFKRFDDGMPVICGTEFYNQTKKTGNTTKNFLGVSGLSCYYWYEIK